jgi:hypothetical protein
MLFQDTECNDCDHLLGEDGDDNLGNMIVVREDLNFTVDEGIETNKPIPLQMVAGGYCYHMDLAPACINPFCIPNGFQITVNATVTVEK